MEFHKPDPCECGVCLIPVLLLHEDDGYTAVLLVVGREDLGIVDLEGRCVAGNGTGENGDALVSAVLIKSDVIQVLQKF